MTPPETRYAKSGELRIAYQVAGSGPLDLVYVPGFVSNIDLFWEIPEWAYFFGRISALSQPSRSEWMTFAPSWMPLAPSGRRCSVYPKAGR